MTKFKLSNQELGNRRRSIVAIAFLLEPQIGRISWLNNFENFENLLASACLEKGAEETLTMSRLFCPGRLPML